MLNLDPIWLADTQQTHFRLLLDAMARPGLCQPLSVRPESGSTVLAILATLLDAEVTLADPDNLLSNGDWPMLQVKAACAEQADYVICDGSRAPGFTPKLGTLPNPNQSATVILVVEAIGEGDTQLNLTGPGIANSNELLLKGLDRQWLDRRDDWVCSFPLGVDFILMDDRQLVALPRTTQVEIS